MPQPNNNITAIYPYKHGGLDYAEICNLGLNPEEILDFSINCNPFGPPPKTKSVWKNFPFDRYPDSESTKLRNKLADLLGVLPINIMAGNGSTEIIRLIAMAYLNIADKALIPQPTYSEYEAACRLVNTQIIKEPLASKEPFSIDIDQILNLVNIHQPKAIFLCHPNNPTGQYVDSDDLKKIISSAPNTMIVIDEAYIAFTDNASPSINLINNGNVIIVRSMTKDYALAGLRLGYAVTSMDIISTLAKVKPPWNVSSIAQEAGIIALDSHDYIKECEAKLREAKNFLVSELNQLGLHTVPSQTNFFLAKVGNASKFRKTLLKKGILVRDCTSFGLPEYIRLAPRTMPECQKLIATLKQTMEYKHAS